MPGLTVGQAYKLSFSYFFDACTQDTGFIGVRVAGGGSTRDACDGGSVGVGKFATVVIPFTADARTQNIRFEFVVNRVGTVAKIDNVVVVPA